MLALQPLDAKVPIQQQLAVDAAPVVLVNVFSVDPADADALLAAWEHDANWMKRQPGYISTEGFPQAELRAHPLLRRIVSTPDTVADAIVDCAINGKPERYAPKGYWIAAAARILAPGLVRRATAGETFTPASGSDRH